MYRLRIPIIALEPSLWGTLSNELLHLVFALLPIVRIGQLRVLSKEWKKDIDCKDSKFNQAVFDVTVHHNIFALLPRINFGRISDFGNIYNIQVDKWHSYKVSTVLSLDGVDGGYKASTVLSLDGADGGLVCCVSQWLWLGNNLHFCIVMNPLMNQQRMQLPPLLSMKAEKSNTLLTLLKIVKLIVDKKTKEYQVFVHY